MVQAMVQWDDATTELKLEDNFIEPGGLVMGINALRDRQGRYCPYEGTLGIL